MGTASGAGIGYRIHPWLAVPGSFAGGVLGAGGGLLYGLAIEATTLGDELYEQKYRLDEWW